MGDGEGLSLPRGALGAGGKGVQILRLVLDKRGERNKKRKTKKLIGGQAAAFIIEARP
jgi:hypothetical protein